MCARWVVGRARSTARSRRVRSAELCQQPSAEVAPPDPLPTHTVGVPVTSLWIDPVESARDRRRRSSPTAPDAVAWLAALDAQPDTDEDGDGRLGLHGRVESQLLEGEPVTSAPSSTPTTSGRWARVVAPWQPPPRTSAAIPAGSAPPPRTPDRGPSRNVARPSPGRRCTRSPRCRLRPPGSRHRPPAPGLPSCGAVSRPSATTAQGSCRTPGGGWATSSPETPTRRPTSPRPSRSGRSRSGDLYFFARPPQESTTWASSCDRAGWCTPPRRAASLSRRTCPRAHRHARRRGPAPAPVRVDRRTAPLSSSPVSSRCSSAVRWPPRSSRIGATGSVLLRLLFATVILYAVARPSWRGRSRPTW